MEREGPKVIMVLEFIEGGDRVQRSFGVSINEFNDFDIGTFRAKVQPLGRQAIDQERMERRIFDRMTKLRGRTIDLDSGQA